MRMDLALHLPVSALVGIGAIVLWTLPTPESLYPSLKSNLRAYAVIGCSIHFFCGLAIGKGGSI